MYPHKYVDYIIRKNEGQSGPLPSEDRYLIVQKHNEISPKIFTGILPITGGSQKCSPIFGVTPLILVLIIFGWIIHGLHFVRNQEEPQTVLSSAQEKKSDRELCSREETKGFSEISQKGGTHKSVARAFSDLVSKGVEWSGTPKQSYTLCPCGSEG